MRLKAPYVTAFKRQKDSWNARVMNRQNTRGLCLMYVLSSFLLGAADRIRFKQATGSAVTLPPRSRL